MNTELQNKAWHILPKEFKEEVKERFTMFVNEKKPSDCSYGYLGLLIKLFGVHNLTSDAEGEEMLTVPRSKVMKEHAEARSKMDNAWWQGYMTALQELFGFKCLPDELANKDNFATKEPNPAEPKYHVGQRMAIKYINKIGTIDAVQGYNEEEDGIYYHLKVEPKGVCTAREENLQPYEEPKPVKPFKVGDKVRILSLHGMPTPDKGEVDVIAHINIGNREQMYYLENHYHCAYGFSESDLEPVEIIIKRKKK